MYKMPDNAILKTVPLEAGVEYQKSGPWHLKGWYGVDDLSTQAEIELLNLSSLDRSIIYTNSSQSTYVYIPEGLYEFYSRACEKDIIKQPFVLRRLTLITCLIMLTNKMLTVLRTNGLGRSLTILKRFLFEKTTEKVVGTRIDGGQRTFDVFLDSRPEVQSVQVKAEYVSIIIPTKERVDLLRACIDSLLLLEGVCIEIIIVDNGASLPEMLTYLEGISTRHQVTVFRLDIPFNFSRLCNEGAKRAKYPTLLFLNDDIEATDCSWLSEMLAYLRRDDVGVVGARLLYPSGDLQHAGIATNLIPGPGHPWLALPRRAWESNVLVTQSGDVDAVTGACLMIDRNLFTQLGGFDEEEFAITLNDVDLCLRVREAGLRVIYVAQSTLIHKESQTRRSDDQPDQKGRHRKELAAFYLRHPTAARASVFLPRNFRRDSLNGA